jgi:glycerol-3-phosphate dehydrogenase
MRRATMRIATDVFLMTRPEMLSRVGGRTKPWDIIVIGGGATGMGIAVDAASRGFDVLLLERSDFGAGTSSRSTKLVHGGVRYLQQGNLPLVFEALRERGALLRNAPHLVSKLPFVVPAYRWQDIPYFGSGLQIYSLLAGKNGFGSSRILSRDDALHHIPNLRDAGLRGGVMYFDGQFDDARLLIGLALTAAAHGATLLNYVSVTGSSHNAAGRIDGVTARDEESGSILNLQARTVINATGPFCDGVRRLDDPQAAPIVAPSQGIHLVVDSSFLAGNTALVVPRTSDGRVMFAIPFQGHTLLGTTDTPVPSVDAAPVALQSEVEFVLDTAGRFLERAPQRKDVLSVFAGIRPLIRSSDSKTTAALSRDHTLLTEPSGLITITGGKWTTYRRMAELCVDQAIRVADLPNRDCATRDLAIREPETAGGGPPLHPTLPYTEADVLRSVRHEMARTIEDVLGRRTRALFLRAAAALAMAPRVASIMAPELGWDANRIQSELARFQCIANTYILDNI